MTAPGRPMAIAPGEEADVWTRTYAAVSDPLARVYAFAHSGGGPSTFRRWQGHTDTLEISAIALPGRERRIEEPPARDVADVVGPVSEAIAIRESGREGPVVLLGVSLGAMLAHLVAGRLETLQVPVSLLVSVGAPAPHLPPPPPVHDLPDDVLIDWLLALGGMERHILEYPELVRLLMPTIRADLELSTHQVTDQRIDVPVLTVVGSEDPVCTAADAASWQDLTRRGVRMLPVDGGHFLDDVAVRRVLEEIELHVSSSDRSSTDRAQPDLPAHHDTHEGTPR